MLRPSPPVAAQPAAAAAPPAPSPSGTASSARSAGSARRRGGRGGRGASGGVSRAGAATPAPPHAQRGQRGRAGSLFTELARPRLRMRADAGQEPPRDYLVKDAGRATPLYKYSPVEERELELVAPVPPGTARLIRPLTTGERKRTKEACVLDYAMGKDDSFKEDSFDPGYYHYPEEEGGSAKGAPDAPEEAKACPSSSAIESLFTSADVIKFFSNPKRDDGLKFIRLLPEVAAYAPYDLRVAGMVSGQDEYYVFSATGVVHVAPGKPTEVMQLSEWVRQASLFAAIRKIKLFKTYLINKAFDRWYRNVRKCLFESTRAKVAQQLLLTKRVFSQTLAEVNALSHSLQDVSCVSMQTRQELITAHSESDNDLNKFKDMQVSQRQKAVKDLMAIIESIEHRVLECCEGVRIRADVPDAGSLEVVKQYLKGQMEDEGNSTIVSIDLNRHIAPRVARDIAMRHNTTIQLPPAVPHVTLQGSLAEVMETKAELEEYLQTSPTTILKTRVKVRSMAQERASLLSRMSNIKRFMDEGVSLGCFISVVKYIVAENLFKFSLVQSERFKNALTASATDRDDLIFLRLQLCYQEPSVVFHPGQDTIQALYRDSLRHIADLVKECRFTHAFKFSVYRTGDNSLQNISCASDLRFQRTQQDVRDIVAASFEAAHSFAARFSCIHTHWRFLSDGWEEVNERWAQPETVQPEVFKATLAHLASIRADLSGVYNKCLGSLYVTMLSAKEDITPLLDERERHTEQVMLQGWRTRVEGLIKDIAEAKRSLSDTTTKLDSFAALARAIRNVDSILHTFGAREEESELLFEAIERRDFRVSIEDRGLRETLVGSPALIDTLRDLLASAKDHRHNKVQAVIADLEDQIDGILRDFSAIDMQLSAPALTSASTQPSAALQQLEECDKDVTEKEQRLEELISCQEAVGCERLKYTFSTRELLVSRTRLWESVGEWKRAHEEVHTAQLAEVDVASYKVKVGEFLVEATAFHEDQRLDISRSFLEQVEEELKHLPLIEDLCNPAMKADHWKPIFDALHRTFVEAATYNLECLLNWNVNNHALLVEYQSNMATGQSGVERTLAEIEAEWDVQRITTGQVQSQQIITNSQSLLSLLDDTSLRVEKLMNSEFLQNLHNNVKRWMERLSMSRDTLTSWKSLETGRIEMLAVTKTSVVDPKELVPIDTRMKELLAEAVSGKPALRVLTDTKVIAALTEANDGFIYLRENLEQLLTAKRKANPRLLTLSNAELLEALSAEPDVTLAFPHLRRVVYDPATGACIRLASRDGEDLPLVEPLPPNENSALFLGALEGAMVAALKEEVRRATLAAVDEETSLGDWIFRHVAQAVQVADDIHWTSVIEVAIGGGTVEPLRKAVAEHLMSLQNLAVTEITPTQRVSLTSMILLALQRRDRIGSLVAHAVHSVNDYVWAKHFRRYADTAGKGHLVKQCAFSQPYGHEYYGCRARLVQTPFVDRAFCIFSTSLYALKSPIVLGGHQVGRTAVVKDYAQAAGNHIVVVNCVPAMEVGPALKAILGAAQSGLWILFDDVHNLPPTVFRAVGHLISTINALYQTGKHLLTYAGTKTPLKAGLAFFLTAKLQHTTLPQCVKDTLCPVSMAAPEFEPLAQTMFLSGGFAMSAMLGTKLASLFAFARHTKLNRSGIMGLRTLLKVVRCAQDIRVSHPGTLADVCVANAVRQTIECSIDAGDMKLFLALLERCFDNHSDRVAQVEAAHLEGTGSIAHPALVSQVNTVVSVLAQSRQLLVFGPSLSGKSTCLQCTAHVTQMALKRLYPAAYSARELFGATSPKTGAWESGIVASLMSRVTSPTMLVLDGPPLGWIDPVLPALDTERQFKLANNELVRLSEHLAVVLECESLAEASPSLVTRVLHIHFSSDSLSFVLLKKLQADLTESASSAAANLIQRFAEWVSKNISMTCADVSALSLLLKALLKQHSGAPHSEKYGMLLFHAAVWTLGGRVPEERPQWQERLAPLWALLCPAQQLPECIFSVEPDVRTLEWMPWANRLAPHTYPDPHLLSATSLAASLLRSGCNVVFAGPTGCGKSFALQHVTALVQGEYVGIMKGSTAHNVTSLLKGSEANLFVDDLHIADDVSVVESLRQLALHQAYYTAGTLIIENAVSTPMLLTVAQRTPRNLGRTVGHMVQLAWPDLVEERASAALSHLLRGRLSDCAYRERLLPSLDKVVKAGVAALSAASTCLRSITVNPQYVFSLATVKQCSDTFGLWVHTATKAEEMLSLWLYALRRAVCDRCIGSDLVWAENTLQQIFETSVGQVPPATEYAEDSVADPTALQIKLRALLDKSIYFGARRVRDCLHAARSLRLPSGSLVIHGDPASGRRTVFQGAAMLEEIRVLEVGANHADVLKEAVLQAACHGVRVACLVETRRMSQGDFPHDALPSVVGTLLALVGGKLPSFLFTPEFTSDVARVLSKSNDERNQSVLERVRRGCMQHLHLVVICDPPGAAALQQSIPSLMTVSNHLCLTLRSEPTLSQMAYEMLCEALNITEAQHMADLCAAAHLEALSASDAGGVPPPSMHNLVALTQLLSSEGHKAVGQKLVKLKRASALVKDIRVRKERGMKRLQELIPNLRELGDLTDVKEKVVEKDTQSLTEVNVQLSHDKEQLVHMEDTAEALEKNLRMSLDAVKPQVSYAQDAVQSTTKKDIDELLSIRTPSPKIMLVMTCLLDMFALQPGWDSSKRFLVDRPAAKLAAFEIEENVERILQSCKSAMDNPDFHPSNLRIINPGAAALCQWVRAVYMTAQQYQACEPTQRLLNDANTQLQHLRGVVASLTASATQMELALIKSEDEYKKAKSSYLDAQDVRLKEEMAVERASTFADAILSKTQFWESEEKRLAEVGTPEYRFVHSAVCAYAGPFTPPQRETYIRALQRIVGAEITGLWQPQSKAHHPGIHEAWVQAGLPQDEHSHQSAYLLEHCTRVPLLADPHGISAPWVCGMHPGIVVCRPLGLDNASEALESGVPVMVEGVDELTDELLQLAEVASQGNTARLFLVATRVLVHPLVEPILFAAAEGVEPAMEAGLSRQNDPKQFLELASKLVTVLALRLKCSGFEDTLLDILYQAGDEPSASPTISAEVRSTANTSDSLLSEVQVHTSEVTAILEARQTYRPSPASVRLFLYLARRYAEGGGSIFLFGMGPFLSLLNLGASVRHVVCPGLLRRDRALFWLCAEAMDIVEEGVMTEGEASFIVDEPHPQAPSLAAAKEIVQDACSEQSAKVFEGLLSSLPFEQVCAQAPEAARSWLHTQAQLRDAHMLLFSAALGEDALRAAGERLYPEVLQLTMRGFTALDHSFCKVPVIIPVLDGCADAYHDVRRVAQQNSHIDSVVTVTATESLKEIISRLHVAMHLGQWLIFYDHSLCPSVLLRVMHEVNTAVIESTFRLFVVADPACIPTYLMSESVKLVFDKPSDVRMTFYSAKQSLSLKPNASSARKHLAMRVCMLHALVWRLNHVSKWDTAHLYTYGCLTTARSEDANLEGVALDMYAALDSTSWGTLRVRAVLREVMQAVTANAHLDTDDDAIAMLNMLTPAEPYLPLCFQAEAERTPVTKRELQELTDLINLDDMHPDCTAPLEGNRDEENPYASVLRREVEAYNRLLLRIESDVREYVFENPAAEILENFAVFTVPHSWQALCMREQTLPLAAWMRDVGNKSQWFQEWVREGPPPSYWISAFFFRSAFLSSMMLFSSSQKLHQLAGCSFACTVTSYEDGDAVDKYPDTGNYVHGLTIMGGRWSNSHRKILPEAGASSDLPVILMVPVPSFKIDCTSKAEFPLYKSCVSEQTLDVVSDSLFLPCDRATEATKRGTRLVTES